MPPACSASFAPLPNFDHFQPVVEETKKSLLAHELIKVRIDVDGADERKRLAEQLAVAAGAEVAGAIGKIAILYRARDEKPTIKLPG